MNKNENGPLNLYTNSILCKKLIETLDEFMKQGQISETFKSKMLTKFDEIMCQEISKEPKTKNTIKGKVISFRNCDDIWIFYCKDTNIKFDKGSINFSKLKIIALDEKLKDKKNDQKYKVNQVAQG